MINIIVATDEDLLIGKKDSRNGMPWNVPEDLQHFKATTLNKTILMGLTTYQAVLCLIVKLLLLVLNRLKMNE